MAEIKKTVKKAEPAKKEAPKKVAPAKKEAAPKEVATEEKKRIKSNNMEVKEKRSMEKKEFIEQNVATEENEVILDIRNLKKYFVLKKTLMGKPISTLKAVDDVSFKVKPGETLGIVGESGCGKSVTSLSTMRLVQGPSGQITSGSIRFRTNAFRRDKFGRKIPVYETEEVNGETVIKEIVKKEYLYFLLANNFSFYFNKYEKKCLKHLFHFII